MIISIVNDDGMLQNYNMINDSDNIIALLGSVYCIQGSMCYLSGTNTLTFSVFPRWIGMILVVYNKHQRMLGRMICKTMLTTLSFVN